MPKPIRSTIILFYKDAKQLPFQTFHEPDEVERLMKKAKADGVDCKLNGPLSGDPNSTERFLFVTRSDLLFYFVDDYNDHGGLSIVGPNTPIRSIQ